MPDNKPKYKRVLLKLSGESLLGDLPYGIDLDSTRSIALEIKEIQRAGSGDRDHDRRGKYLQRDTRF